MPETITCYCGNPATLRSNGLLYNGREYGNGKAWICIKFPLCRGSVGTHPDGRPLGTIADPETKELRQQVHALIDPIWQNSGLTGKSRRGKRGAVYGWMAAIMGFENNSYHTGELTAAECRRAIELIALYPYDEYRAKVKAEREEI